MLKIKWRCWWFGHTGTRTESGFHVCDRCGLHEYHSSDDYQKCAMVWTPWHWLVRMWHRIITPILIRRSVRRMLEREDDGMPF